FGQVREMALMNGEPDLSADQLVAHAERLESQNFTRNIKQRVANPAWRAKNLPIMKELCAALVANMDGAQLVELFGPKTVDSIARHTLLALRKNPLPVAEPTQAEQPPPQSRPRPSHGSQSVL